MTQVRICAAVLVVAMAGLAAAQVSQTAVPFLLIAPGARAGGMGETFVSIADDATATHWNPAGLGRYPLSPQWLELPAGKNQRIEMIALVKNENVENDYRQYDVWAVINGHLAFWDGKRWVTGQRENLPAGKSVRDVLATRLGMTAGEIDPYLTKVLTFNTHIERRRLQSLSEKADTYTWEDDAKRERFRLDAARLDSAWHELQLTLSALTQVEKVFGGIAADGYISNAELDSVSAAIHAAISGRRATSFGVPFDLNIKATINCLESQDGRIYVGTDSGFYRYDPNNRTWKEYGLADSLPSLRILALKKVGRKGLVIGTDNGVAYFNGVRVKTYSDQERPPSGAIRAIAAIDEQNIWVAADNDLYHYDGGVWKNYTTRDVAVGEDIERIISKFYRAIALIEPDRLRDLVRQFNSFAPGADSLAVGDKVKLPFAPAIRGPITCLAARDNWLWIGTEAGVVLYDGQGFGHYGYREYAATAGQRVTEIAREFLPDGDSAKLARLAEKIRLYNGLESDILEHDKTLLVYANVLGSHIYSVAAPATRRAYVGTATGVVEFRNGKWNRFSRLELVKRPIHAISTELGEVWFASRDKVYVLARARGQATFMHSNYLVQLASDLYYDYFAIVYPTSEWGTFGTGFTFLSYGQQDRTDEIGRVIGQFNSYDFAWTVSYGTRLSKKLAAGISGRIIISHLADVGAGLEKGSGVGFSGAVDGGILYDLDRRTVLGATITNIGPEIAYIDADQADPLPRKLAVAFAYKLLDSPFNKLTIVGEANKLLVDLNDDIKTEIREIIPHIGAEYWYSNYFALRAGYVYDDIGVQKYLTLGGSLQYSRLRIDLSYIPSSNEETNRLGNTVRISLNVGF